MEPKVKTPYPRWKQRLIDWLFVLAVGYLFYLAGAGMTLRQFGWFEPSMNAEAHALYKKWFILKWHQDHPDTFVPASPGGKRSQ